MNATFETLRSTMLDCAGGMIVARDEPDLLELNAPWPNPTRPSQPMWFGAVRAGKCYVSVHLMPLYVDAGLKASVPPELLKRMQGKTCFNFTRIDDALLDQLADLIRRSSERFAGPAS